MTRSSALGLPFLVLACSGLGASYAIPKRQVDTESFDALMKELESIDMPELQPIGDVVGTATAAYEDPGIPIYDSQTAPIAASTGAPFPLDSEEELQPDPFLPVTDEAITPLEPTIAEELPPPVETFSQALPLTTDVPPPPTSPPFETFPSDITDELPPAITDVFSPATTEGLPPAMTDVFSPATTDAFPPALTNVLPFPDEIPTPTTSQLMIEPPPPTVVSEVLPPPTSAPITSAPPLPTNTAIENPPNPEPESTDMGTVPGHVTYTIPDSPSTSRVSISLPDITLDPSIFTTLPPLEESLTKTEAVPSSTMMDDFTFSDPFTSGIPPNSQITSVSATVTSSTASGSNGSWTWTSNSLTFTTSITVDASQTGSAKPSNATSTESSSASTAAHHADRSMLVTCTLVVLSGIAFGAWLC